jgi:hypothetical protein
MTTLLTSANRIDNRPLTETLGTPVITDENLTETLTQPIEINKTFPAGKVPGRDEY